jgi:opacity protein-like surface antigen
MMKKLYLLTCLLVLVTVVAEAQSFYSVRRNRALILSVGTGTSTYFGELKNKGDFMDAKPNITAGLSYFVLPNVAVRGDVTWFQLSGTDAEADDPSRVARNLSFSANNFEVAFTGALNLREHPYRYYQRPNFNGYVFLGLALLYSNPAADYNGGRYALQPMQTEGVKYSRLNIAIPFGAGVRLKVSPFLNLALEGGYRKTFTDYLDDVSTVHPDKTGWDATRAALSDRRPELGLAPYEPGTQRGNPDKDDGYFLLNFKVEYFLPTNFKSPNSYRKVRRPYRR